jgi:hypothetical protein
MVVRILPRSLEIPIDGRLEMRSGWMALRRDLEEKL